MVAPEGRPINRQWVRNQVVQLFILERWATQLLIP